MNDRLVFSPELIDLYRKIRQYEAKRKGGLEFSPIGKIADMFISPADIIKSSLLQRLNDGKLPLIFAPPKSYSYPAYDYIEKEKAFDIIADTPNEKLSDKVKRHTDGIAYWPWKKGGHIIYIDQTAWKVVEIVDDENAILTYPDWEDLGYRWHFGKTAISAESSERFMVCRSQGNRMTKYSQFLSDTEIRIRENENIARIAMDEEQSKNFVEKAGQEHGDHSKLREAAAEQSLDAARKRIEERRKNGLPDFMSDDEINKSVMEKVQRSIFPNGDMIIKGDDIYWNTWQLKRISPAGEIPLEHYLDVSNGVRPF